MVSKELGPGQPGRGDPAAHSRVGMPNTEVRRQAGPPATHHQDIEQAFDVTEDTGKRLQRQGYPVRWLKQRYRLSTTTRPL